MAVVNDYVRSGKIIDNSYLDIRISNATCIIDDPEQLKLPDYDNKGFYK